MLVVEGTSVVKRRTNEEREEELLELGRQALGVSATELARQLGVAPKTVWRWLGRRTTIGPRALAAVAHLVHPHDEALAERIHAFATKGLVEARLPAPAPLPASRPSAAAEEASAFPTRLRVETVVYAACKAADTTPRVAQSVLVAALRRAREVGFSVEDLERELSPPVGSKKAAKEE